MKKGDKVVCIANRFYTHINADINNYDPKKGDILTIDGELNSHGQRYFSFEEIQYLDCYNAREFYDCDGFRKIDPRSNALSKELAESFIEQDSKVKEQEYDKVFTTKANF